MRCRPTNPRHDAHLPIRPLRAPPGHAAAPRRPATGDARRARIRPPVGVDRTPRSPGHQGRVARTRVARIGRRGEQPAGAGFRAAQATGAGGHRHRRRPRLPLHAGAGAGRRVRTTAAARRQAQPARAGLVVHWARTRAHGFARDACAPPARDARRRSAASARRVWRCNSPPTSPTRMPTASGSWTSRRFPIRASLPMRSRRRSGSGRSRAGRSSKCCNGSSRTGRSCSSSTTASIC